MDVTFYHDVMDAQGLIFSEIKKAFDNVGLYCVRWNVCLEDSTKKQKLVPITLTMEIPFIRLNETNFGPVLREVLPEHISQYYVFEDEFHRMNVERNSKGVLELRDTLDKCLNRTHISRFELISQDSKGNYTIFKYEPDVECKLTEPIVINMYQKPIADA